MHAIRRFRGDDNDLIKLYKRAKSEVDEYLKTLAASDRQQLTET
jgi:hypothetical protein